MLYGKFKNKKTAMIHGVPAPPNREKKEKKMELFMGRHGPSKQTKKKQCHGPSNPNKKMTIFIKFLKLYIFSF